MNPLDIKINIEDLPPSGLKDFFFIVSSTEDSKGDEEKRMTDKTTRKFQLKMLINRGIEFADKIDLNSDEKTGTSFLIIPDKAKEAIISYRYGTCKGIKNEKNEISSIIGEIETENWLDAIKKFMDGIYPIIDVLSYDANCPIIISRIYCLDIKNNIEVISYYVPYKLSKINEHIGNAYIEMMPIMALYREAKNSYSPFYKFLCYYKILEGVYDNIRPKFFKMARKNGFSVDTLEEKVPSHKAIDSSFSGLIGKSIKGVYQTLFTAKFRNVVAHFIVRDGRILNVSDFQANNDFLAVLTILEYCVRKVVDNQNKYFDMFYKNSTTTKGKY